MTDLITREEYKTLVGKSSGTDDEKLDILIPAVSQLVKTYCNSSLIDNYDANSTVIEEFDIQWDTYTVQLKYSPIVNVVSVQERSSLSEAYTVLVANTDYYIDTRSDSIFRVNEYGRYINYYKGTGAVKVEYNSGYANTPTDLKLAVIDLVTYYLKDERKERRTFGASSIVYPSDSDNGSWPDYIKRVLDTYRL